MSTKLKRETNKAGHTRAATLAERFGRKSPPTPPPPQRGGGGDWGGSEEDLIDMNN